MPDVLNNKFIVEFFAPGIAAPGGSKKAFFNPKNPHRPIITDDAGEKNKTWRSVVAIAAREEYRGRPLLDEPLHVEFHFKFPRPKGHFRAKDGSLKLDAPLFKTSMPDLTKLIRAAEDALTGILWVDDACIAIQVASKTYTAATAGCTIRVMKARFDAESVGTVQDRGLQAIEGESKTLFGS